MEAYLSRGVTGSGPIERRLTEQNEGLGRAALSAAESVSKNMDEVKAGRAIESGLQDFVVRSKGRQKELYAEVDKYVDDAERVPVENVKALLDDLHTDIPGAPAQSALLRDPAAMRLRAAIKKDTEGFESVAANPEYAHLFNGKSVSDTTKALFAEFSADGKTPYEALRRVRTFVGANMREPSLTKATRDNFSKIYGALSADMNSVIWSKGPEATKAFQNANNFTREFHKRMELVDTAIDKNGGPEKVFKAAIAGTDDGDSVIKAVMRSLPQENQDAVSAMVLDRLGRSKGRKFSMDTFRKNWDEMSPRARDRLFGNLNPQAKDFVANIAKVVDIKKRGSRAFGGDKAGGSALVQQWQIGSGLLSAIPLVTSANPFPLLGYGAILGAGYGGGRAMTSPGALRFAGQRSAPINYGTQGQIAAMQRGLFSE
jgi:hypothetical protein